MAYKMAVRGLMHQHSRLTGDLQTLREHECRLQATIDDAKARIAKIRAEIALIEEKRHSLQNAASSAFNTDISSTTPRRTWAKSHFASWGELTRTILRRLGEANGVPMTTADLARNVDHTLGLELDEAGLHKLQSSIRYRMKALRNHGLVWRASDGPSKGTFSTWVIAEIAK